MMTTFLKYTAAAALTGLLALAAVTPSQAAGGRNAAAAIGFGAGAVAGAAVANAANGGYYGPGYAPGYAYDSGYAYDDSYAYEAAPVYAEPAPVYYYGSGRGYPRNTHGCESSPASPNFAASC